jgi:hypothetical protein
MAWRLDGRVEGSHGAVAVAVATTHTSVSVEREGAAPRRHESRAGAQGGRPAAVVAALELEGGTQLGSEFVGDNHKGPLITGGNPFFAK